MSTRRTKAQTVQVRIFSTQTEPRKKFYISQLFLKFHMASFPVSVKSFFLKKINEKMACQQGEQNPRNFSPLIAPKISPGFYFLEPLR